MVENENAGITPPRFRDMVCLELFNVFGYTSGELRRVCDRHHDFIEVQRRSGTSYIEVARLIAAADTTGSAPLN